MGNGIFVITPPLTTRYFLSESPSSPASRSFASSGHRCVRIVIFAVKDRRRVDKLCVFCVKMRRGSGDGCGWGGGVFGRWSLRRLLLDSPLVGRRLAHTAHTAHSGNLSY